MANEEKYIRKINGYLLKDEYVRDALKNLVTNEKLNEAIESIELKEGPQGEQGPKGDQGEQGPKGDQGTTDYNQLDNLPDLTIYATETFVTNKIAEAQLSGDETEVDLSGYATKDDLLLKSDMGHIHSYIELTNKPVIPSIEGLATEEYVQVMINNIELKQGPQGEQGPVGPEGPQGPKGDQGEQGQPGTTDYNQLENLPNLSIYATEDFVTNKIAEAQLSGDETEVDLSGYATTEYVMEVIGGKRIVYIKHEDYMLLSDSDKNDENIVYNIIDSNDVFVNKVDLAAAESKIEVLESTVSALQTKISILETTISLQATTITDMQTILEGLSATPEEE